MGKIGMGLYMSSSWGPKNAPVTLAVMLSPAAGFSRMLLHRDALARRSWRELSDPGSAGWIPFGEAERLLGLAGGAVLCALSLVLLERWLARRRSAPGLALAAAGLAWALWLADGLLELAAATEPAAPALALLGRLLGLGLALGLLAAYLLRSERVRLTFVR